METLANQTTFRSYLIFWIGQLVSVLGSSIARFVVVWWITLETQSTFYVSIVFLAGYAPVVLLGPFAGVYVDRWNRKALIGLVDFLQALTSLALIVFFWLGVVTYWHVLALTLIGSVFHAFHMPAVSALVPLLVPRDKLSRINGINYLFTSVMNFIGPLVAAFLMLFWKVQQILWIDVVTFLIAIVPLLVIAIPSVRKRHENTQDKPSFRKEFTEGFAFIKTGKGVLSTLALATVINFLFMPMATLLSYYVSVDHMGGASDYAFVVSSQQVGMFAGGVLMSVRKGFKRKMLVAFFFLYVLFAGYGIMALAPKGFFWFMAIGGFVAFFALPVVNVLVLTIIQTVVPPDIFGRVNSVAMALTNVASPLGMISSGALAGFIGTANLFLGCSLVGMLTVTLSSLFTDIRHLEKLEQKMDQPGNSTVAR